MSQPRIRIYMTGDRKAVLRFRRMQNNLGDMRPVWRRFAVVVSRFNALQYASDGAWGGARWAPLNPEYRARKMREGHSGSILVRTGRMLRDATNPSKLLHRPRPSRAAIGIATPYYHFHHTGTQHMPARPILRLKNRRLTRQLRELMADHAVTPGFGRGVRP